LRLFLWRSNEFFKHLKQTFKASTKCMKRAKHFLIFLFICCCAGLASININAQTLGNPTLTDAAEKISGDKFKVSAKTPKGASVYAVKSPTSSVLRAIDKGLTDLFAIARKHEYRTRLNYSDYSVYIARSDLRENRKGNYTPAFAINQIGTYAGSVYDQGGFIYVAGMVISFKPSAFLIVENNKNLNFTSDIVRYEGEHIVLYHNDRKLFDQTQDHSKGGAHPILQ